MDRIFEQNHIETMCSEIKRILEESKEYMEDILAIANSAEEVWDSVPEEAKDYSVSKAVGQLRTCINNIDLDSVICILDSCRNNVNDNILDADRRYAQETDSLRESVEQISEAVSNIRQFLVDMPLNMDCETFLAALEVARKKSRDILGDMDTTLNHLLMNVKGEETKSVWFSKDPVNLSTGNFIYSHIDITIPGRTPMVFRRFYNSVNNRSGVLGCDWNHNYDIWLDTEQKEKILHLEDGREERFYLLSNGHYATLFHDCGRFFQKEQEYFYVTREQKTYAFNIDGQCIRIEEPCGDSLRFLYQKTAGGQKRLFRVEKDTGEFFQFAYDNAGYLKLLADHTGRAVEFSVAESRLVSVSTLQGGSYTYRYSCEGKLTGIINPEGVETIGNVYDEKMRVVGQRFPDGSEMKYDYNDKTGEVYLTERNGSRIIYVHDNQYRDIRHVYRDGQETFEYNKYNQRTQFVDKLGNRTIYGYDDRGNRTVIINPLGDEMRLQYGEYNRLEKVEINGVKKVVNRYDGEGNLVASEDGEGNVFSFFYERKGIVSRVLQPDGGEVIFKRDERGNITNLYAPDGAEYRFVYDDLNQISETVDGNGNLTKYEYDKRGNIHKVINANGDSRTYFYNKNNKVTKIIDFDGNSICRKYNSLNLPEQVTDKAGRTTRLTYDVMWNLARVTQPDGASTTFLYNEDNNLTRIRNANGDLVRYTYDALGRRISQTDEMGNVSRFYYDAVGNLIKAESPEGECTAYEYDAEGRITNVQDALGNEVHLKYDRNGKLIMETNPLGERREYTYDCMGRLSTIRNEVGEITSYHYDKCGRLVCIRYPEGLCSEYTYDKNGNVKSFTNPKGYTVRYFYDSLDRLIKVEGEQGEYKLYGYDCLGNIIWMEDGRGARTNYEYSITGKLTRVIDPLGNETIYEYDVRDRLLSISQYGTEKMKELQEAQKINEKNCHSTYYEHDLMGNLTKITDSLGNCERFEYDKAGRLIAKIDQEGYLTQYRYTPSGMINQIQYADGREVKLSYNPIRQLIQMEDWLGITRFENDAMGHITQVRYPDGKSVSYTYGPRGERTGIKYPDGEEVEYTYSESRRLKSLAYRGLKISYGYDEAGFLSEKQFSNGMKARYSYDDRGQLTCMAHSNEKGILEEYHFTYDAYGDRRKIVRNCAEREWESGTYEYGYDLLGRLTDVLKDGVKERVFQYDAFGNRTSMLEGQKETIYTYDIMNRLISEKSAGTEKNYIYDKRGNLCRITENEKLLSRFLYGAANQLEESVSGSGEGLKYVYNGAGQRVSEELYRGPNGGINCTKKIDYYLDMTRQYHNVLQKREDEKKQTFFWDDGIVAMTEDGRENFFYYLKDEHGSPVHLMDMKGKVIQSYSYDEFGRNRNPKNESPIQPFGFICYEFSSISDAYFAHIREYQPGTGRFAAMDILPGVKHIPVTMNAYVYCHNNPIRLADRNGMWPSLDDIRDTLSDWGDAAGDILDDWGDAVHDFMEDPHKVISQTIDNVSEAVSGGVKWVGSAITQFGQENGLIMEIIKRSLEVPIEWGLHSPLMIPVTIATQQGWIDDILADADFHRDRAGIFHTSPDCWQQYLGYCDLYDWAFDVGTKMKSNKYSVTLENGESYCIWMWKGDYLNLGAGAETGIYKGGEPFWTVSVEDALPMTLALYDKEGNVIMCYNPSDPQWWITGFEPMVQKAKADELVVIGSIDFSTNPELWKAYKEKYAGNQETLCFDEENLILYYKY